MREYVVAVAITRLYVVYADHETEAERIACLAAEEEGHEVVSVVRVTSMYEEDDV